jgi:hypothetical protein
MKRRNIIIAIGTIKAVIRTVASYNNKITLEDNVDIYIISFTFNQPRNNGFYLNLLFPLLSDQDT